ncbi:hypothetical protein Tco_1569094 [Tanacetum coccineum]
MAWLRSVSRLSMKKKLGKKESVSKQGRKNAKSGPKLDDSAFDDLDADLAHVIAEDKGSGEKGGSTVSTARPDVGTARQEIGTADLTTPPTTTIIFDDEEMTLADTLVKMKDNKAKGVVFKDTKELVRPARSVLTLKPLPSIDPKHKGKGVLEEPEPAKKMPRCDFDAAQVARVAKIENLYDEVQVRIDADHELAVRLTHEEQEKYNVNERAKLLAEFFKKRKKQLAEERATVIRNKPPTRTQLRSLMMTYLKHTSRSKHIQLNKRTLKEIQALYIKEQERAINFVHIGSEGDERLI